MTLPRLAADRHPAQLYVAEEDHPVRAPVLHRVREYVDVHERAPGLSASELTQFSVGMPQAEGSLARINSCSEQFEFEDRVQIAILRRRG